MTPRADPAGLPGFGRRPLGGGSLALSVAVHAVAAAAVFWVIPMLQPDRPVYRVVELRMVSTPPPQAAPEEPDPAPDDELIVETPDEPEPPPEPEVEEVVPALDEEPEPEEESDSVETAEPEPVETAPPEEVPVPAESREDDDEDQGVADLQVRQEGFKADYPEYYARILMQVRRCLQRSSEGRTARSLAATVRFVVERSGATARFGVERSSGDTPFDIAVLGALECAGMADRLGPLPEDYPYEFLHVTLLVTPRGGGSEAPQTGDDS